MTTKRIQINKIIMLISCKKYSMQANTTRSKSHEKKHKLLISRPSAIKGDIFDGDTCLFRRRHKRGHINISGTDSVAAKQFNIADAIPK